MEVRCRFPSGYTNHRFINIPFSEALKELNGDDFRSDYHPYFRLLNSKVMVLAGRGGKGSAAASAAIPKGA